MTSLIERVIKAWSGEPEHIANAKTPNQWGNSGSEPQLMPAGVEKAPFVFTPAKAAFCLFVGLTLWLAVLYNVRHNTPSASGHLPTDPLPSQTAVGAPAGTVASNSVALETAAFGGNSYANAGATYAATINTSGFASQPITLASPDLAPYQPRYATGIDNSVQQRRLKVVINH